MNTMDPNIWLAKKFYKDKQHIHDKAWDVDQYKNMNFNSTLPDVKKFDSRASTMAGLASGATTLGMAGLGAGAGYGLMQYFEDKNADEETRKRNRKIAAGGGGLFGLLASRIGGDYSIAARAANGVYDYGAANYNGERIAKLLEHNAKLRALEETFAKAKKDGYSVDDMTYEKALPWEDSAEAAYTRDMNNELLRYRDAYDDEGYFVGKKNFATGVGAGVGALAGAGIGALGYKFFSNEKDKKKRSRNMAIAALATGLLGAGYGGYKARHMV
jgi:hypothetical protein